MVIFEFVFNTKLLLALPLKVPFNVKVLLPIANFPLVRFNALFTCKSVPRVKVAVDLFNVNVCNSLEPDVNEMLAAVMAPVPFTVNTELELPAKVAPVPVILPSTVKVCPFKFSTPAVNVNVVDTLSAEPNPKLPAPLFTVNVPNV